MPNYKQAPKLYHNKSSFVQKLKNKNYYNLPQELMDCVFQELDGKCGNQIKIMTVLLGTLGDGSFGVSEKWICERTGMLQQSYNTARKALISRGWIHLEDGKLYVLPQIIRFGFPIPQGASQAEIEQIKIDTISKCVNEIRNISTTDGMTQCDIVAKAQYDNVAKAQYDNVYNINKDKKENKNNNCIGISSPSGSDSPIPVDIPVDGEISQEAANNIINKTMISSSLLLTSTGKYFKIRG